MTQISLIDGKIFLALKTHMDTFTGAAVYYSPNVPQDPTRSTPHIVIDDVRIDTDTRYTQADAPDEYRGILNMSVMVPMQWTAAQAIGLASATADHWDKGAWYAYDDVRLQAMRRPKIIGAGYQDAGMIRYPVQVMWRAVG